MRLSRLADYGTVVMGYMAGIPRPSTPQRGYRRPSGSRRRRSASCSRSLSRRGLLGLPARIPRRYRLSRAPGASPWPRWWRRWRGPSALTECSAGDVPVQHGAGVHRPEELAADQPAAPGGAGRRHRGGSREEADAEGAVGTHPRGRGGETDATVAVDPPVVTTNEPSSGHGKRGGSGQGMGGPGISLGVRHHGGADTVPKGLNEDTIRGISARKGEPEFLLERRLKAYRHWLTMIEPRWSTVCYSAHRFPGHQLLFGPEALEGPSGNLDEVDPEVLRTYERLGIPLLEQKRLAAWRWMRSSTASRWRPPTRRSWRKWGSFSAPSPRRCRSIHGSWRSISGRWSPTRQLLRIAELGRLHRRARSATSRRACGARGVVHLFRINAENTGQFERTLLVADAGSYVSYLEGCTRRAGTRTSCTPRW